MIKFFNILKFLLECNYKGFRRGYFIFVFWISGFLFIKREVYVVSVYLSVVFILLVVFEMILGGIWIIVLSYVFILLVY